jgi:phosphate uptake regulator
MKRQLIQHGPSSLTITLPRKWILQHGLTKDDEVYLTVDEQVHVSAREHKPKKEASIDIAGQDHLIRRIIASYYKAGYDTLHVHFNTAQELESVQKLVQDQLSGFEITDQQRNKLTITMVFPDESDAFEQHFRRFMRIINQMSQDMADAARNNDAQWIASPTLLKVQSDKFADICRRQLNTKNIPYARPHYVLVEQSEKIADHYHNLGTLLSKHMRKPRHVLLSLAQLRQALYDLYYTYSPKVLKQLNQQHKTLLALLRKKNNTLITQECYTIANLIWEMNGAVLTIRSSNT